jgi:general L-amino acid transport system substrate-binding protein
MIPKPSRAPACSLFLALVIGLAGTSAIAQSPAPAAMQSPTLNAVKERGQLNCGVIGSAPNFSLPDSQGVMRGLDADNCRAVATAVLGDPDKVRFISLTPAQRLVAVQSGEVDVAFAQITWTLTRESKSGVQFTGVYFFDAWGLMVPKSLKVTEPKGLNGGSICMIAGPGETNSAEFFGKLNVKFKPVAFSEGEQMRKAFLSQRCDAMFHSLSAMASFRGTLGAQKDDYALLEITHGREPLAGAVRKGDDRWFDIVRYTFNAQIAAEELGVTSQTVAGLAGSNVPDIKRLLGTDGDLGPSLGLDRAWAANVITKVGNYGEMFERALGASGMPRGQNRLVENGGLMFALPMR